ncbi:hypothetical protein HU200_026391 [Digitaria exilis]|uniref:Uncharacterized protein n=1 Tax=Digitaria exilis TaxID=1010633 RepID=A0A835ERN5_9POAL|nr:hypothetical protein HU200_026391 [Digitaria exilis]
MEVRIPQPEEPEGPSAAATPTTEAPAPPPVPHDDEGAPVPLSSGEESSDEGEFEFPFVSRDSPAGTAAPADELFADGRIRTFYPVFGRGGLVGGGGCVHAAGIHGGAARSAPAVAPPRVRGQLGRLFLEETRARNSSTSSTASSSSAATEDDDYGDGLEGAAPESYCVWRPGSGSSAPASPSPRPPRKRSGSTGSMARWRRISDLVVGRSHSDGKEKFIFFATPPHEAAPNKDKPKPKAASAGGRKPPLATPATDVDTATAAHMAYLAKGGVVPGGTPRRTFLPYREELVGFFANVNGVSRSHQHPF